jgi:hypothetical protein
MSILLPSEKKLMIQVHRMHVMISGEKIGLKILKLIIRFDFLFGATVPLNSDLLR